MSDSNVTKQALVKSLKEVMNEMPFEKISVGGIVMRCT